MSKHFKGQPCIYCLVRPSMNQGDHVFARQFFPVSERDNLPKVPCCDQCNNDKSRLEHYLVTVLPFGAQHADSLSNLKTMVPPRLVKNRRLHRELRDGQERILSEEPSGVIAQTTTLSFDGDQLHRLIAYIVKALIWHHWRVTMPTEFGVCVSSFTTEFELFFAGRLKACNAIQRNVGNGSFCYEGGHGIDYPQLSI